MMKHLKLVIVTILLFLTTGCWNYRELENLAIVGGIGIDKAENGFVITIEVINPKKAGSSPQSGGGSSEETSTVIYKTEAPTIREALTKTVLESPKKFYIGHMSLLVISEEVAKNGINDFIDFFVRDTESRKVFTMVVVKEHKAEDVLKILEHLQSITASNIQQRFDTVTKYYGSISNESFDEVLMCLYTEGREPTVASIAIEGSVEEGSKNENLSSTAPKGSIIIDGAAIFKKDKLVGYLDSKESIFYSMIRSKVTSTNLSFPCDNKDNYGAVVIDNLSNEYTVEKTKDGPLAKITISGNGAIAGYNCNIDMQDPKSVDKMEKMINKELETQLKHVISKVQKLNADIFGFAEQLYRNSNAYWKTLKDDWDKIYPTVKYEVKGKIKVERISSTIDTARGR